MKRICFLMILLMVFQTISLFAQSSESEFKPDARVTFFDNTVLELSNFQIHSRHDRKFGSNVYYTNADNFSTTSINIPFKQGNFWQEIPLKNIEKITLTDSVARWFDAEIVLLSGKSLIGQIPKNPDQMWRKGRTFFVNGTVEILGKEGTIKLPIKEIKEITRNKDNPDVFILTSINNEIKKITKIYLTCYWHFGDDGFNTWSAKISSNSVDFIIDDTEVKIKMQDIDSIAFLPKEWAYFIKLKDGNAATGKPKIGFSKIKGNTKSGLILYQEFPGYRNSYDDKDKQGKLIKSIKFL